MEESKERIIKMVDKMPAFPKSVHRILELTSDINCDPKALVQVIEHDPVLIVRILNVVNSAAFGLSRKITSINHAVVYVGLNTVKNLALSTATIGMLPRKNKAGFNMDHFLMHSLSTAAISRVLARRQGIGETELFDYFLAGLLHDIGKIVFAQFVPMKFKDALMLAEEQSIHLHKAEKEVFNANHAQVGALLTERWQLPDNIVNSIANHHSAHKNSDKRTLIDDCLFVANQISKELNYGFGGEKIVDEMTDAMIERFGMDLKQIIASLGDISNEIEKNRIFIKV
ncbi:signal transduction protein [Candidatus Magnetoovum chiemensis]|nr:signal transduction protein [Candidatus Magnetoovum chiemensis]